MLYLSTARYVESRAADCTAAGTPYTLCTNAETWSGAADTVAGMSIITCATATCFASASELADKNAMFCDSDASARAGNVGYAPHGCVRWIEDLSGCRAGGSNHTGCWDCTDAANYGGSCANGACCQTVGSPHEDEWVSGPETGQDDTSQVAYIPVGLNGLPVLWATPTSRMHAEGVSINQPAGLERQSSNVADCGTGDASVFVLVKLTAPGADYCLFGTGTDCFGVDIATNSLVWDCAGGVGNSPELTGETSPNAVTPGAWQLLEAHKVSGALSYFVDGIEVTSGSPTDAGTCSVRYVLSHNVNAGVQGSEAFLAAFVAICGGLTGPQRQAVRDRLSEVYDWRATGSSVSGGSFGGGP